MRNALTLLRALLRRGPSPGVGEAVTAPFRVTPLDVGLSTLKSDRYFAVAEAAQLDFLVRTGLAKPLLARRVNWVNLAQACRFERPLKLLQRFEVSTQVVCTDDRHAYFSHRFSSAQGLHAEVLVKVKFKQGRLTVPPVQALGLVPSAKPAHLQLLDQMLQAAPR
jgi:hypothetical protein